LTTLGANGRRNAQAQAR